MFDSLTKRTKVLALATVGSAIATAVVYFKDRDDDVEIEAIEVREGNDPITLQF